MSNNNDLAQHFADLANENGWFCPESVSSTYKFQPRSVQASDYAPGKGFSEELFRKTDSNFEVLVDDCLFQSPLNPENPDFSLQSEMNYYFDSIDAIGASFENESIFVSCDDFEGWSYNRFVEEALSGSDEIGEVAAARWDEHSEHEAEREAEQEALKAAMRETFAENMSPYAEACEKNGWVPVGFERPHSFFRQTGAYDFEVLHLNGDSPFLNHIVDKYSNSLDEFVDSYIHLEDPYYDRENHNDDFNMVQINCEDGDSKSFIDAVLSCSSQIAEQVESKQHAAHFDRLDKNAASNEIISEDNFYKFTKGRFTPCPVPEREPDLKTKESSYWYSNEGVVRQSNHWGGEIASCSWTFGDEPEQPCWNLKSLGQRCGEIKWADFETPHATIQLTHQFGELDYSRLGATPISTGHNQYGDFDVFLIQRDWFHEEGNVFSFANNEVKYKTSRSEFYTSANGNAYLDPQSQAISTAWKEERNRHYSNGTNVPALDVWLSGQTDNPFYGELAKDLLSSEKGKEASTSYTISDKAAESRTACDDIGGAHEKEDIELGDNAR